MKSALVPVLVAALCLVGCANVSVTPIPASSTIPLIPAALTTFYNQPARWHNCGIADCATVTVPVDYLHPGGPTTSLDVTRVKATGTSIGALFVNPGGPGGSAFDYAKAADNMLNASVLAHFDIIGVDPRGVGHSSPIHCMSDAQIDRMSSANTSTHDAGQIQAALNAARIPEQACAASTDPLIAHMGTADAARDLDIVRQVVGDASFNYLGKSYGSELGQVYAALFPERVGRMVLDGVLPASIDTVMMTKDQAVSFEAAIRNFAAYCGQKPACPLHGSVDQQVRQVRSWMDSLTSSPLAGSNGRTLTEGLANAAVLNWLYFPPSDYDQLIPALSAAMQSGNPKPLLQLLDQRDGRNAAGHYTDNSTDAYYAVDCTDHPYSGTVTQTQATAQQWRAQAPTFGADLAWGMLACSHWPHAAALPTNLSAVTATVMVVSTRHDPATPHSWGVQVAARFPHSALVTWNSWQHTAYGQGSACVDDAVDTYLLAGSAAPSTLC